ncbi:MAG: LapA family protein [Candidatus Omnitrophica bacterium]|nr:LapA family protein [Candidatus Omnitrophota bacterium]
MKVKMIGLAVLGVAAALFILQNVAAVTVQFLLWSITLSRSLLIMLVLAAGFIIGWFARGAGLFHRQKTQPDGGAQ